MNAVKEWTTADPVAPQPRPRKGSIIIGYSQYILPKDATKEIKSIGPISSRFWPLDRTTYSRKDECSQIVNNSRPVAP
jgi:hypothetical protein